MASKMVETIKYWRKANFNIVLKIFLIENQTKLS